MRRMIISLIAYDNRTTFKQTQEYIKPLLKQLKSHVRTAIKS